MTEQQILSRLTAACSKAEHCIYEMRQRMMRWEIDEKTQQKVIDYLLKERYIDEERYARAFIRSKMEYNRWGRRKVEQALYAKHIGRDIYEPLLNEIDSEDYEELLMPLLKNKLRQLRSASSTKDKSDYEIRQRLYRYAMQRGFSFDQAEKVVEKLC